ncbi:hypothetical protein ABZP36_010878 [Zizania latifolia]
MPPAADGANVIGSTPFETAPSAPSLSLPPIAVIIALVAVVTDTQQAPSVTPPTAESSTILHLTPAATFHPTTAVTPKAAVQPDLPRAGPEKTLLAAAKDPEQNVATTADNDAANEDVQSWILAGVADYGRVRQVTNIDPIELPSAFFSFDAGKYVDRTQLAKTAPQAAALVPDEVRAILSNILWWLKDPIGVLVNDLGSIRACFNDIMNQLPMDLVTVLTPTSFLEFHQPCYHQIQQ